MVKSIENLVRRICINLLSQNILDKKLEKMEEDFANSLEVERKRKHLELIDERIKSYEDILKYTGKSTVKKKVSVHLNYWKQAREEYEEIYNKISELEEDGM